MWQKRVIVISSKINVLSGTCGVTDVKFILGPPAIEGRVPIGETHFTEQDLMRPVELRILHTEIKKGFR